MANEVLWFVPATGGGPYLPQASGTGPINLPEQFNVQWDTNTYPTVQATITQHPFFDVHSVTQFDSGSGPSSPDVPGKLRNCFARFVWDSCNDPDGEFPNDISLGGQLNIGTVFSRELNVQHGDGTLPISYKWDIVEVFAKYRVDETDRLSKIYLTICDEAGNSHPFPNPSDDLTNASDDTWRVVGTRKDGSWDDPLWSSSNLRACLTFFGTTTPANVGRVVVDVEWFAFRLTDFTES